MTGIFLYLKHVADLLDRCYEREALHANHIHSFAPALRFAEQFAGADELAAHSTFKRDRFKSDLWPDPDFDERFLKARDDGSHLNSPYRKPSIDPETGRHERRVFPSVDVWLNIRPLKPREDESGKRAGLKFDWLFPIRHLGCAGGCGPFASLRELEAILRIYIEMFRLIEPELEAALVKDSTERAA